MSKMPEHNIEGKNSKDLGVNNAEMEILFMTC
jgi:hypothetical protein